jgi:hypothetical protein
MTRHAIRGLYAAPALAIALLSGCAAAAPRSPSAAVPDAPEISPTTTPDLDRASLRPNIIDAGGLRSVLAIEQRAKHGAIERRQSSPAVDFCARIETRLHGNRAFVEGMVANGSRFVVRNVRVCIKGECDYTTPSTLRPGAQATFRVPAKLERYVSGPDYRITWDVMPGRDE